MKTIIYSCLSILLLYMTYRYCIELKSHNITKLNYKTYVIKSSNVNDSLQMEIEKSSDWCRFIEALIQIESRGVENAVGDNGKSVGVLQIQTVYIDELIRHGVTKFSYLDRYNRDKSVEMFEAMMDLKNPNRDIITAIKLHNPKARADYYKKIFIEMFKTKIYA